MVALHLATGRTLHLRSVLAVHNEYVTLEAYQDERVEGMRSPRWKAEAVPGQSLPAMLRAVVAYGGIVALTVTPETEGLPRAGFLG